MLRPDKKKDDIFSTTENKPVSDSSIIGSSLYISGEIRGNEDLVIEGRHKGKIDLKNNTLIVKRNAKVQGNIYVENIDVQGKVEGTIYASGKVDVRNGANIAGDIFASRISIENGAQYKGSVKMSDPLK
jgi:cytoskeletal protein CcmA (bactofilin family)